MKAPYKWKGITGSVSWRGQECGWAAHSLNQRLHGSAHHLWPGATYLLKKSLEDTGDVVRRVPRQLYQCSAILKGLTQPLHTHPRPTDPIDTLQGKGYLDYDLAISGTGHLWGQSGMRMSPTCKARARCSISAVHLVTTKGTSSGKSLGSCRKSTPKRGVRAGSRRCPQRMRRVSRQRL